MNLKNKVGKFDKLEINNIKGLGESEKIDVTVNLTEQIQVAFLGVMTFEGDTTGKKHNIYIEVNNETQPKT